MYKVNRSWDRLRTCIVGKSYPPEFYSYITNQNVRETMERIATETEEDYQNLIAVLERFGVEVLRPTVPTDWRETLTINGSLSAPPMSPGNLGAMIRDTFYFTDMNFKHHWDKLRGGDWPIEPPNNQQEYDQLNESIKNELKEFNIDSGIKFSEHWWDDVIAKIDNQKIFNTEIANINTVVLDDEIYFLTDRDNYYDKIILGDDYYKNKLIDLPHTFEITETSQYVKIPMQFINPNLVFVVHDGVSNPVYKSNFSKYPITYLTGVDVGITTSDSPRDSNSLWSLSHNNIDESVVNIQSSWLQPVIDIDMLVLDENNVICNTHNDKVFQLLAANKVTPHVVNFRHADFWLHGFNALVCPIHREN
jgi:hypothetical protein